MIATVSFYRDFRLTSLRSKLATCERKTIEGVVKYLENIRLIAELVFSRLAKLQWRKRSSAALACLINKFLLLGRGVVNFFFFFSSLSGSVAHAYISDSVPPGVRGDRRYASRTVCSLMVSNSIKQRRERCSCHG